jgi:hypothetical protein
MKKLFVIYVLFIFASNVCAQNTTDVEIDFGQTVLASRFQPGVTHTQNSIDPWNDPEAAADAKILLKNSTRFQNQHIMGWGALNPWPDSTVVNPENWNWNSLDNRMQLIRETKGETVITLCGAPTWMHTPSKNGETDWGKIETAPTPDHFDDFARLCAVVARRYPDVMYYQVWNELKGFWHAGLNRWRYEDYTRMYNMIYDSLKAVNPNIKIGGPYPVVSTYSAQKSFTSDLGGEYGNFDKRPLDVIEYWLEHKKGADFIAIDGKTKNKDEIWNVDAFQSADKFADIIGWIRQQSHGGADLDIWWSEWYAYSRPEDPSENIDFHNALMASSLIKCIKAGSSAVLIWQPEGDKDGFSFPLGLWTSTDNAGGGKPTPFYDTYSHFKEHFSEGAEIVKTSFNSEDINTIATKDKVLMVNQGNTVTEATINGEQPVLLNPYEVKLMDAIATFSHSAKESEIKVFYNAQNSRLNIRNLNTKRESIKYKIFDVTGKMLVNGEVTEGTGCHINLNGFREGIYHYRISVGNTKLNDRFIITKY